ncbi:DUF5993 family protein [Microbulbifer sp. GL-2]|nr:DUF5993 family protein [Microbulbifer sp. GL-2]
MSVWYIWNGRRQAAIACWLVTLAIYLTWFAYHWTNRLNLSF